MGIPRSSRSLDGRPPRIAEPEEAGHLVERLTCSVVEGLAELAVATRPFHGDQHSVPARHQQHHERPGKVAMVQQSREEMALQMVDAHEREPPSERQSLGLAHTHEQGADEARAHSCGDSVDRGHLGRLERQPCLFEGALHHDSEDLEVSTARQLWNDPAKSRVDVDLACHHRRADIATPDHHRGRCLVTRSLNAKRYAARAPLDHCGALSRDSIPLNLSE